MTSDMTNSNVGVLHQIQQKLGDARFFRRHAAIVLGVALFMRLAVVAMFWSTWGWRHGAIPDDWNKLAINLINNGAFGFSPGQSTITRGPIFPLIEMPLYLVFGERYAGWCICLLLLDVFTCFLIIALYRKLWGNLPALLAGLFYAIYLPIIFYTAKISQVTSILPFVVLYMYLMSSWDKTYSSRWKPWVLGLVSGLMILNKTVYLPVPIACSALLIWSKRSELKRFSQLLPVALYLFTTIIVVVPWTVRNFIVTGGKLIPVQSLYWELNVQDVLYYDLNNQVGLDRPDSVTLAYFIQHERQMLIANGVNPDYPKSMSRAEWDYAREQAFRSVYLQWCKQDPGKILHVKVENLWNFWFRAENWRKTKLMILMQVPYLAFVIVCLTVLFRKRQLYQLKYGLTIILMLWAEHCPVFAWGRFSLDLVPILALIFGVGVSEWINQFQNNGVEKPA